MIEEKVCLHELGNLLTVIGGASFLLDKMVKNANMELINKVAIINKCAQRAMRVVAASRWTTINNDRSVIDLHTAVAETESILRMMTGEHANLSLDSETNCMVAVDPIDTDEILINLVKNAAEAIKTTGRRGTISVVVKRSQCKATCLTCGENVTGEYVTLAVSNDGPQIPASVIDTLFERGYTTKKYGSGIGLYVVRLKTHLAGGHVTVVSNPTLTTFKIYLPVAEKATECSPVKHNLPPGKKAAILVQERSVLKMLEEFLSTMGVNVVPDCSSEENTLELVICDSKSSNIGVVQEMLAHNHKVKVMCITDHCIDTNGAARVHFLVNPFSYEKFVGTVCGILAPNSSKNN